MDLRELISLVVSLLAMIIFMGRGAWDKAQRKRAEKADAGAEKEEYTLEEFLSSISQDVKKKKQKHAQKPSIVKTPPPKPAPPPTPILVSQAPASPPSSRRAIKDDFQFETNIDNRRQHSKVEERVFKTEVEEQPFDAMGAHIVSEDLQRKQQESAYAIETQAQQIRARSLLERPHSRRDMILYHEIIGTPKALRTPLHILIG